MATVDELLAGITTVDKTLVISNDFRTINIPSSVPNLGVEYDDDVLRLDFKMPRYISGTDLSTFAIRINYINSKGESDAYTVSDAKVYSEYITFSWLVGPTATRYKGNTKFNVCAKTIKADGTVDREFNTTIATLPVLEGLEVDESIVTEYSDIIEQWKQELFGIGDTEEASIRLVSLEAQKEILQAGARVLDTIPPDYATAVSMTDNADRTKSDAIVCTKRGEIIAASDSSDDYIRGLKILGKTTQASTTGKNIADLRKVSAKDLKTASATAVLSNNYGTTLSATSGDSITVTQSKWPNTSAPNSYQNGDILFGFYCPLKVGDVITISFDYEITDDPLGVGGTYFTLQLNTDYQSTAMVTGNKVILHKSVFSSSVSAADGWNYVDFRNCGTSGVLSNFQVEYGDTATAYEPYTGGIPSPSPDYPQELKSVKNPTVNIYGKNLLNADMLVGGSFVKDATGYTFTKLQNTATSATYPLNLPAGDYVLSWGEIERTAESYRVYINYTDGTQQLTGLTNLGSNKLRISTSSGIKDIRLSLASNVTVNTYVKFAWLQLEAGTDATEYEPYVQKQSIDNDYSLSGIQLKSGGYHSHIDTDGNKWICDEIDFERGVYVKRVNELVCDGTEGWVDSTTYPAYTLMLPRQAATGLCTHMNRLTVTELRNGQQGVYLEWSGYALVQMKEYFPTLSGFEAFLAEQYANGTPVTFRYAFEVPIETPLTQEEIEWFRFAHTNCPNTMVLNDAGATMELTYNADTKTYLNNCFRPTDDQVQASVDAWLTEHYTSAEGVKF